MAWQDVTAGAEKNHDNYTSALQVIAILHEQMDRYQPDNDGVFDRPPERPLGASRFEPLPQPNPVVHQPPSNPYTSSLSGDVMVQNSSDDRPRIKYGASRPDYPLGENHNAGTGLSKKWQRRLYWMVPLGILAIVIAVLFEVYKKNFEIWARPLTDWLRKREAWSWTIPVAILFILSFPPLFGHEIVQLLVGLTYPLGVALGIACAGAILGELGCFIVFKYIFTGWVEKKIATKIKWAATARVTQEAGFRGVLVIRYSIVPPHLANPLFACTGMKLWLYMATVVLSLPKTLVFVALGTPASENSKGAKWAKVVAIGVVVIITIFASWWIRKKMTVAIKEIAAERSLSQGEGDEEFAMLNPHVPFNGPEDTSYERPSTTAQYPYRGSSNNDISYQRPATTKAFSGSVTAKNDTSLHEPATTAQFPYQRATNNETSYQSPASTAPYPRPSTKALGASLTSMFPHPGPEATEPGLSFQGTATTAPYPHEAQVNRDTSYQSTTTTAPYPQEAPADNDYSTPAPARSFSWENVGGDKSHQ